MPDPQGGKRRVGNESTRGTLLRARDRSDELFALDAHQLQHPTDVRVRRRIERDPSYFRGLPAKPRDDFPGGGFADPPLASEIRVPEKRDGFFLATEDRENPLVVDPADDQGCGRASLSSEDQPVWYVCRFRNPFGRRHAPGERRLGWARSWPRRPDGTLRVPSGDRSPGSTGFSAAPIDVLRPQPRRRLPISVPSARRRGSPAPLLALRAVRTLLDSLQLVIPIQLRAPVLEAHLHRPIAEMAVGVLYRADAPPAAPLCRVQDPDLHTRSCVL